MSATPSPDSAPPSVEQIGVRVKRLRLERGMSQDRLAIDAHVDQSGLSKFERGRESTRRLGRTAIERIARVLGTTYEELVAGTDYPG